MAAYGQQVQVSRTNKTIAVTAEESVSVEPDLAVVAFGYQNYGLTEKQAYDDNLRVADAIVKAIVGAGIEKKFIENSKVAMQRVEPDSAANWTLEQRKQRQFTAEQSWKVTVAAAEAQMLADLAMHAGANRLEDVVWEVSDRVALQAKAGGAALAKARSIADQMAKGLNAKVGELVYASNQAPVNIYGSEYGQQRGMPVMEPTPATTAPALTLFPRKVKETATVQAVFAVE
jgi:uncharacterized protein YggE